MKNQKQFSKKTLNMLTDFYDKNKNTLLEAGYDKTTFLDNIKALTISNNCYAKGALKIFSHKEPFVSKAQVSFENIISSMKQFKYENTNESTYTDFRKDVIGWKNKIDPSKIGYLDGCITYDGINGKVKLILITGPSGSQYWTWESLEDNI